MTLPLVKADDCLLDDEVLTLSSYPPESVASTCSGVGENTPAPDGFRSGVGVFEAEPVTAPGVALVELENSAPDSAEPAVLVEDVAVVPEDVVDDTASCAVAVNCDPAIRNAIIIKNVWTVERVIRLLPSPWDIASAQPNLRQLLRAYNIGRRTHNGLV